MVVKPIASSASRDVRRMPVDRARAWLASQDGLWLVEEAVAVEREFHCDGVFHDGRVSWLVISEYDRPALQTTGTWGTSFLRSDDPLRPRLTDLTRRVIEALDAGDGVFHVEFLYDGAHLSFGEVGARPAARLGRTAACHDRSGHLGRLRGRATRPRPPRFRARASGGRDQRDALGPPQRGRQPATAAAEAGRLPGVVLIGEGNTTRGADPTNSCDFEYRAYFEGLTAEGPPG
ncbi:hypothetical protein ACFQ3Z_44150 [Streptomyces nogalater]